MKVGTVPLAVGVMVTGARVLGAETAADALGCLYLMLTTLMMMRSGGLTASVRV